MSDEETITVEVPISEARALEAHGGNLAPGMVRATRQALAEHDAWQNPLSLPWGTENVTPGAPYGWALCRTIDGKLLPGQTGNTEAQARLMAAAPELADALEMLLKPRAETLDGRLAGDHARRVARAALRKAGR